MRTLVKNKSGFTLVELLMAMVTGMIVLAGIYAAFNSQQKIHTKESQVVDAEQNVRGAAHFMVREIRLAGMDQTGMAGAGFVIAGPHSIRFTLDRNDDEDVLDADEDIVIKGRIAHCKNITEPKDSNPANKYQCGIQFAEVDKKNKNIIAKFITKFIANLKK